jgi:hypothetical protein
MQAGAHSTGSGRRWSVGAAVVARLAHGPAPLSLTRLSKGVRSFDTLEILRRAAGGGPKPTRPSEPPAAAFEVPPASLVPPGVATVAARDRPPTAFLDGLIP